VRFKNPESLRVQSLLGFNIKDCSSDSEEVDRMFDVMFDTVGLCVRIFFKLVIT
jgi:hypothetical protein